MLKLSNIHVGGDLSGGWGIRVTLVASGSSHLTEIGFSDTPFVWIGLRALLDASKKFIF